MVLLEDFLINHQEANQLPIYKRGLNSIKKSHPPKEAPRCPCGQTAGLSSPDFKFQVPRALDTTWIANYIIRTFIHVKFGYKFWDGTCALPITKN